jgi:phosphate transport system permease protein
MTSERTLAQWLVRSSPQRIAFTPKTNGVLAVDREGQLHHWMIDNPHPEFSWSALFGKVWYEGYDQPAYIWQSSGGTDDFESKFSLVPLIFGTLKGTFYALLFALPIAILGALYCSQFLEKRLRNPIKSAVELMAALPSVVLGFIAGVVLAPIVQHYMVSILAMPILIPAISIGWLALCRAISTPAVATFVRRHEFWMLLVGGGVGALVATWLGPGIERLVFGGNFEAWLLERAGAHYDQRNSLIVGWVMGFAVIPIIFTICEDAFSAVPKHLVGASLACGASSWQTAWRVVLPAAGSGVFSAVMVGFGRAVGETMIVLMATGNTPVMDWTIFNGFRALSANIAVEIPEAPYGGTLYRVLFVAALLLFAMTFVVNTAAELVRLRLRRGLQGL